MGLIKYYWNKSSSETGASTSRTIAVSDRLLTHDSQFLECVEIY